jgi:hypothetical protein
MIMEESIRKALSAPFPTDAVKNRRGNFGKPINYVEGNAVIARLNDSFGGDWSFAIVETRTLSTHEVLVHGRLTALGIVKEAFGKSSPAISRDTGEVLSEADAYKAAATDALKKSATLLGVALSLYSDDVPEATDEKITAQPRPEPHKIPRPAAPRASSRQVAAIWSLGRRLGLDANAIRQRTIAAHGAFPEQLDKDAASRVIQEFADEVDSQKGAA